ncbi:hypothetical protein M2451_002042 [Dysgonomonas sp. PFB1-18]|uniref:DUF4827 family protein n=1 Tax=unclassified Dysgonomonas TaxID=2630389 RepID=UPI0024765DAB|nr:MULTISPECIES: DUF4827 family protein [unclassified Dysgonomonas]MDH6309774.1 hypothetical protein [Dysgonomonas sp. PF1-14]MDH6339218.1 hypothetical protein [Dysgonomonas sp. PF1-16]MDH6380717.1 hypothetical protein [Dysgonomonas sp. PFB1-18]MDH6398213.1 hypothetical protein [Dysgonomonas sp. PF1-23]
MKKIISFIFAMMAFAIVFTACGGETYADKLKKEEKAINRFIDAQDIKVLRTYPDKHKFADNEFFLDESTGVYFQVVDSGGKDKPSKTDPKTDIYLRYDTIYDLLDNEVIANPNYSGIYMTFKYGDPGTYSSKDYSSTYTSQMYYFMSPACVIPLEYGLGKNATVRLIIPFASGSTVQMSTYTPYFYSLLRYDFTLDVPHE